MVALRNQALRALPEYQPGLGGLFVVGRYRDQGSGTALVRAGMKLAQKQGYARVYAATIIARGILVGLGWTLVQAVSLDDEQTVLYRCELERPSPPTHSS
jgi:N-acetylglutamate synthase-like GNAT family acetyltransferase